MGLDMYLYAERYASGYDFSAPEERDLYATIVEAADAARIADPTTPRATVRVTCAYWRKANQIHKWFVDNVQGGTDDCREYEVAREQLRDLRDLCRRVLASCDLAPGAVRTGTVYNAEHPEGHEEFAEGRVVAEPFLAQELLPTESGFFFGGTDYDEFYYADLEDTVLQVDRALAAPDAFGFLYRSSW